MLMASFHLLTLPPETVIRVILVYIKTVILQLNEKLGQGDVFPLVHRFEKLLKK